MKELSINELNIVFGGAGIKEALENRATELVEPMFHGGAWGWAKTVGDVKKITGFAKGAGAAGAAVTAFQGGYYVGEKINEFELVQNVKDWLIDKAIDMQYGDQSGNDYGDGTSY